MAVTVQTKHQIIHNNLNPLSTSGGIAAAAASAPQHAMACRGTAAARRDVAIACHGGMYGSSDLPWRAVAEMKTHVFHHRDAARG